MTPGSLLVTIDDRIVSIELVGGGSWRLPVGPVTLVDDQLEHAPRPTPEQLTNALGIVTDHLDDAVRESPMLADAPVVAFAGHHADALGRVEIGADHLPDGYEIRRHDADEVFRTLVAETVDDRRHNPGLRRGEAETIIGTCCVVLAVMRRLELDSALIVASGTGSD